MSDTLRQTIADLLYERDADSFGQIADRILDLPTIRRALNIASRLDALDNETFPDKDDGWWNGMVEITDILRAAGETTL